MVHNHTQTMCVVVLFHIQIHLEQHSEMKRRCLPCFFFFLMHASATGIRTRVPRVRAEYPDQLDYSGIWMMLVDAQNNQIDTSLLNVRRNNEVLVPYDFIFKHESQHKCDPVSESTAFFFLELDSVSSPVIATPSFAEHARGGTRAHNLLLRREAPYPLGHTGAEA